MKKLFSTFLLLAAASITYAQTNKFIAVGWNTNNAPVGSVPFVRSATSNGWTASAPGESYFLSASNNTTPYPHFQPIYGSNIVGGVASAGSSNVFLVVSNLTVSNTWVSANISDSNVTTVATITADGNPYDIRWDTHMQIKWDGTIDANVRLATWFTYTDIYGVSTTNMMYDLIPYSSTYLSYNIESTYVHGGNARVDIAVDTDYGWTAGSAFFMPKSNTSITISALRVGSYNGITTGGATNVANYYFTSIGNGSGSSSSESSGSASNVFFLDSPSISWSQIGGSNYAQVTTSLTNAWQNYTLDASNSITSVMTNLFNITSNILWASKVTTNTPLTLLSANQGSSLSNTVDLIAGDSSVTIVTNANKRSFTLTASAGTTGAITNDLYPTPVQMPGSIFTDWNAGTSLLSLSGSGNEATHLSEATLGNIGTKMALYYTGYDSGNTGRISAAYGSLLNGFTKHGVVLAPTPGDWDASSIGGSTHYREGITNYLYYFGGNNAAGFEVDPLSIGVAYSTDGTNYTKYSGNPIMRSNNVAADCVTLYTWFTKKVGPTNYYGYFNAKHNTGAQERIHRAVATNPLGPWTYVGEMYHHTNASVTSDFTVADLPSGGYIAAYWIITNGLPRASFAYSSDLVNWTAVGTGPIVAFVGGRLFYDDGLAYSYCLDQTTVYYTRPKKSNLGAVSGTFSGSGAGLTGVSADVANISSIALALGGDIETYVFSADYDGVSKVYASFGRTAPPLAISSYTFGYDEATSRFFSQSGWDFGGSIVGNATGLTNASPAIATNNATATDGMALVKRGNNLSLETISGSGTGIATNGGTGINNLFTNVTIKGLVLKTTDGGSSVNIDNYSGTDFHFGNLSFSNISSGVYMLAPFASALLQYRFGDTTNVLASAGSSINQVGITNGNVTIPGNIDVAGTFNVGTTTTTNFTIINPWDASNATNLQATNILSTFSLGNIAGGFGGNSFWLGQNAVLISENFHGSATDSRITTSSAQGGSTAQLGYSSGMNGLYRLGSYPTNTGSFGLLRYANSGGMYYSNRLSMDVGFQVLGYELTEHVVGAVNTTTVIAATDAIRWVANTNWSANWIANCMSNSVSTFVTSSVPVTLNSVIRLSIDADTTTARFYTNGVIATTISSNVPVGRSIIPLIRGMATANTGASTIQYNYSDYWWLIFY
jgi:hypothetical protein